MKTRGKGGGWDRFSAERFPRSFLWCGIGRKQGKLPRLGVLVWKKNQKKGKSDRYPAASQPHKPQPPPTQPKTKPKNHKQNKKKKKTTPPKKNPKTPKPPTTPLAEEELGGSINPPRVSSNGPRWHLPEKGRWTIRIALDVDTQKRRKS